MIDTLVIVVYDRFANVEKWLRILRVAQRPKNIIVIHNTDEDFIYDFQNIENAKVIGRKNVGFDTGAFQDVCLNRLPGFPRDWKQLLWCTDDTFPMVENYLDYFALKSGEGVRAMEISHYVREHIRTTGFSIRREVAEKLRFPADPVVTKQHCYLFEHRWYRNTLLDQVRQLKYSATMVAPAASSPMFDTGYHRRLPRDKELALKWGFEAAPDPERQEAGVTIICPIYNSFPAVIASLIMQTYKDWKLLLIHDGPEESGGVAAFINAVNDDRITYLETPQKVGNWGHAIRSEYINKVKTEYLIITNPDNYYVPVFLEYMLKPFTPGRNIVASYCSAMVHSYRNWETQQCRLARGHVDCGGVLLKTEAAQLVGWKSLEHSADWIFFADIIARYGVQKWIAVKGTLFVHN